MTDTIWRIVSDKHFVATPPPPPPGQRVNPLPPGIYDVNEDMMGNLHFMQQPLNMGADQLLTVPDSMAERVLREIRLFHERKDRYRAMGITHKRGVLLHGQPGTGKTSTIVQLAQMFVEQLKGYVLTELDVNVVRKLREVEAEAPILLVLEDVDRWSRNNSEESLLAFLDGDQQVDGVVVVATTNYLSQMPSRLINRPSRFDLVVEVGMPSAALREAYLRQRIPMTLTEETIAALVEASEGLSIAHLKELVLLHVVFELSPAEAATRVRGMAVVANETKKVGLDVRVPTSMRDAAMRAYEVGRF